jgi:hypothetical protein
MIEKMNNGFLDCESVESTYRSLERITGLNRNALNSRLDHYKALNVPVPEANPYNFMVDLITEGQSGTLRHTGTCWFHATRTHDPLSFKKGIKPLSEMLGFFWSFLHSLVADWISEEQWLAFQNKVEAEGYGLCRGVIEARLGATDGGPWGFLIQDVPLHPEHHQNYLRTPEIVEDICRCFKTEFRFDLQQLYFQITSPCIVKFVSRMPRTGEIGCALYYLDHMRAGNDVNWINSWCLNGRGKPIPKEDILNVIVPTAHIDF